MNKKKLIISCISACIILIAVAVIFANTGFLFVHADNLMSGIKPNKIEASDLDSKAVSSAADFSIDLLKQCAISENNTLISPVSVYLALGMTANGAGGNTLTQFESVLGASKVSLNDNNRFCYSFSKKLQDTGSAKVNIANSIWYRDSKSLTVFPEFLQANADYYNASVYQADFDSPQTVNDINNWVKYNTKGNIEKIIESIQPNTMMYLINTVYFDAEWETIYEKNNVHSDTFTKVDNSSVSADFMYSKEYTYIKDDMAQGFIKPYHDKYSFVAILPN